MSEQIESLPCPFCNSQLELFGHDINSKKKIVMTYRHPIFKSSDGFRCPLNALVFTAEAWNTRPLESALAAQVQAQAIKIDDFELFDRASEEIIKRQIVRISAMKGELVECMAECKYAEREMIRYGNISGWPTDMPLDYAYAINALHAATAKAGEVKYEEVTNKSALARIAALEDENADFKAGIKGNYVESLRLQVETLSSELTALKEAVRELVEYLDRGDMRGNQYTDLVSAVRKQVTP